MSSEVHVRFRELMERGLVAGLDPDEERALAEHVAGCAECGAYQEANGAVVGGLKGFSFEAGPELNAKVMMAVRQRAREVEGRRKTAERWVRFGLMAVVLTVVGSVLDLWVGHVAARMLDLRPHAVRESLMALWILPSFGLLLLFPLLPWLTGDASGRRRAL
ncbi:MAG: hypothetical protein WBY53_15895 [Acidobacteriaceae bacterium]